MFRGLTVVIIIVGLIALLVLGPRYLRHVSEPSEGDAAEVATCDLDFQSCEWSTVDGTWSLSLVEAGAGGSGRILTVEVPPGVVEDQPLIAVLKGHSMYMGEYPIPLSPNGPSGQLTGNIDPPVCSQDPDMIWSVTLRAGQTPIEMNTTAIFQANPH